MRRGVIAALATSQERCEAAELDRLLGRHGAVLLRGSGAPRSRAGFLRWSDAVEPGGFRAAGAGRVLGGDNGRAPVDGHPSLFTTTGPGYDHPVPLHGELHFHQRRPPRRLWLYCERAPRSGGATLVCDGVRLLAALPDEIRHACETRPLAYTRHHAPEVWPRLYGTADPERLGAACEAAGIALELRDDGAIATRFLAPAVRRSSGVPAFVNNLLPFALRELEEPNATRARVRWADGERIPPEWVREIDRLARKLAIEVRWQRGDVVVLDNHRMLHGRDDLGRGPRRILVRLSPAG